MEKRKIKLARGAKAFCVKRASASARAISSGVEAAAMAKAIKEVAQ